MRALCFIVAMATAWYAPAQTAITDVFKLKWKTHIGNTTYRSNILHYGGFVIVGSNGQHYKDYALDSGNGLYILDAATGRKMHHLEHDPLGDMDVNGVVASGDRIYFGSDNDEVHCYTLQGQKVWRAPVSGDVEVQPVLLDANADGVKDVVFVTESGEVGALDGTDGTQLWSFKIPSFSGWKKSQNRFAFKVGDWFTNGTGFMAPPQLIDVNGDAVMDVLASARDNHTYALDGATGKLLWRFEQNNWCSQPSVIYKVGNETRILMQGVYEANGRWSTVMVCINAQGKRVYTTPVFGGVNEVSQPTLVGNEAVYTSWDSVHVFNFKTGEKRSAPFNATLGGGRSYSYYTGKGFVADVLNLGSPQLIMADQEGKLVLFSWQTLAKLREFALPTGTETSLELTDIDCDGRMDMLITGYNGYLYCYATPITVKAFAAIN